MSAARPGVVYLVGAGPGDPGLMTLRAAELVASADVVLHDRLIPHGALDAARADAELVFVGKRPGAPEMPQEEIERLMADRARSGRSIVRLKGGDPFVFGRGGEEAEALAGAGVPFEVVPGVTAGVAAPAYAGIPVTHRDDASAVAFVTGHEDPAKGDSALDWEALARFPGTLVLYMGVRRMPEIAARLIEAGRDPGEPAAAIERGTTPGQRTVTATLAELPDAVAEAEIRAPAIVLTGPVAARRKTVAWLEQRPLHGRRVVVTRARAQANATVAAIGPGTAAALAERGIVADVVPERSIAEALVEALGGLEVEGRPVLVARAAEARDVLPEALRERGANVDVVALYETVAEDADAGVIAAAQGADYVTFTSSSTVKNFVQAVGDRFPDGARIVSIGPVTSDAAREAGLTVNVEAERHDPDGLVEALVADSASTPG